MSKLSEMLSYVAKHSKQRKTTKVIKLQWIASIWCQKHQTNAKLQKWSYFDEFQSIWRQNYQNIWVRSQNYKSNQITMDCIDLTSKRSKLLSYVPKLQSNRITINCIDLMPKRSRMLSYVAKHSKQRKTTKVIKYNELHRFRQNIKTTQNYESDQITMNCIDLTSKRSKTVELGRKTTKVIKLQWIASIWRQNDQSNVDWYVAKHSKQRPKTTKEIKLQWIWSIWHQNDLKCWVTSQNYKCDHITMNLHRFDVKTSNYESDQCIASICQNDQECWVTQNIQITTTSNDLKCWVTSKSNYNELHRFDVKTIKNVELRRKTFKTTQTTTN